MPGSNDFTTPSQFLVGHHPETQIENTPRGRVGCAALLHSPSLRSRVSVLAVAAVSALKDSCTWAALPEQNGAEGGGRDQ